MPFQFVDKLQLWVVPSIFCQGNGGQGLTNMLLAQLDPSLVIRIILVFCWYTPAWAWVYLTMCAPPNQPAGPTEWQY